MSRYIYSFQPLSQDYPLSAYILHRSSSAALLFHATEMQQCKLSTVFRGMVCAGTGIQELKLI